VFSSVGRASDHGAGGQAFENPIKQSFIFFGAEWKSADIFFDGCEIFCSELSVQIEFYFSQCFACKLFYCCSGACDC
jgi:hypothetical protein